MCLRRKKKGKSKVPSIGFCLRDAEAEQRALQFLHIYCSNVSSYSSASESMKQNPQDKTLDLSICFRYKHITSLKNLPLPAPSENLLCWFHCNSYVCFESLIERMFLSAFAYRYEMRC